jgi:glycosyltransferase involved in cell wall biosynthesis
MALPASGTAAFPDLATARIWIVIPCFKVTAHIEEVIRKVPAWVAGIVCVDDACPENSGGFIAERVTDPRVAVVRLAQNQGVGGATLAGYAEAIRRGARILVKIDGDDQMDLAHLASLVAPILIGEADYAKGNRFTSQSHMQGMPMLRVFGNVGLSFASKLSTGYWNVFDPTNGYTALEASVAALILEKPVARRFFFETDLLYHLGTVRAVVRDVPMPSRYGDEVSNLKVGSVLFPFAARHLRNWVRRILGQYLIRDFNVATLEMLFGLASLGFGLAYALYWLAVREPGQAASAGMVMGSALPIIVGVQLLLQAVNFDVMNTPTRPIHLYLRTIVALSPGGGDERPPEVELEQVHARSRDGAQG